jgi:hypothetical protein
MRRGTCFKARSLCSFLVGLAIFYTPFLFYRSCYNTYREEVIF